VDDCFVLAANYVTSYNYSAGTTPPVLSHAFMLQIGLRTIATRPRQRATGGHPIEPAGHLPEDGFPALRGQFEWVDIANMIMTSHALSPPFVSHPGLCCGAGLMAAARRLHAQTVAVMVNGEPITNYDIEQRSKLTFLTTHKPASRQQVIDELIDEKVKIKEGKKFGVDPTAPISISRTRR
jgi:hypothetical protein